MGRRREVDSGRKDSQGRTVRVSDAAISSRATAPAPGVVVQRPTGPIGVDEIESGDLIWYQVGREQRRNRVEGTHQMADGGVRVEFADGTELVVWSPTKVHRHSNT